MVTWVRKHQQHLHPHGGEESWVDFQVWPDCSLRSFGWVGIILSECSNMTALAQVVSEVTVFRCWGRYRMSTTEATAERSSAKNVMLQTLTLISSPILTILVACRFCIDEFFSWTPSATSDDLDLFQTVFFACALQCLRMALLTWSAFFFVSNPLLF